MDACTPYEWERKPIEIFLDEDMKKKVLSSGKNTVLRIGVQRYANPEIGAQQKESC